MTNKISQLSKYLTPENIGGAAGALGGGALGYLATPSKDKRIKSLMALLGAAGGGYGGYQVGKGISSRDAQIAGLKGDVEAQKSHEERAIREVMTMRDAIENELKSSQAKSAQQIAALTSKLEAANKYIDDNKVEIAKGQANTQKNTQGMKERAAAARAETEAKARKMEESGDQGTAAAGRNLIDMEEKRKVKDVGNLGKKLDITLPEGTPERIARKETIQGNTSDIPAPVGAGGQIGRDIAKKLETAPQAVKDWFANVQLPQ